MKLDFRFLCSHLNVTFSHSDLDKTQLNNRRRRFFSQPGIKNAGSAGLLYVDTLLLGFLSSVDGEEMEMNTE